MVREDGVLLGPESGEDAVHKSSDDVLGGDLSPDELPSCPCGSVEVIVATLWDDHSGSFVADEDPGNGVHINIIGF